jgi:tRNA(Arg) A34 adenosine deaminase TadA
MGASHEDFMRRAIELARASMEAGNGGPFGAVIVRENQIIGEGANHVIAHNDPTAHGEIMAIRDACARLGTFSLEGAAIYTTGQPCPMCLGAIHWARLTRIYYGFRVTDAAAIGFDDSAIFEQFSLPESQRIIPADAVSREAALQLARDYASLPHRIPY